MCNIAEAATAALEMSGLMILVAVGWSFLYYLASAYRKEKKS